MADSRQRAIRLDPLFTDRFFETSNEQEMEVPLPFPLPASATDLPPFLDDSEQGKTYKSNFGKVVDELEAWANQQGLNTAVCKEFKNTYLEYTGSNKEQNATLFHMYHEGIATLAAILTELQNEDIPLKSRVTVIRNLLLGLLECGPGTYTNINKSYAELRSFTKSSVYWMTLRENIAKDKLLEIINEFDFSEELQKILNLESMEIHYVNAVLNKFHKKLGIHFIPDDNIKFCNREFVELLFNTFSACFPELLSLEAICAAALVQLDVDQLQANISTHVTASLEELEIALLRQGAELEDLPLYSPHNIAVASNKDGSISTAWNTRYILFLSIYSRMTRKGFINASTVSSYPLEEDSCIVYLPNTTLQLAFVRHGTTITPFLSFCAETLMEMDSDAKIKIMDFLDGHERKDENYIEILIALACYYYSGACTLPNSLVRINIILLQFIPKIERFSPEELLQLLTAFKGVQRVTCLDSVDADLDALVDLVNGVDELLALFDSKDAWRVLEKISYEKRKEELTFSRLRLLLSHSPRDKANAILFQHAPTFDFLILMLTTFPLAEWRQHVSALSLDRITSLFSQFSKLPGQLRLLNTEQLETFTELFETKLLPTFIQLQIDELSDQPPLFDNYAEKIQAFVTLQKSMENTLFAECFKPWLIAYSEIISRNTTMATFFNHPNNARDFLRTLIGIFTTCHKDTSKLNTRTKKT